MNRRVSVRLVAGIIAAIPALVLAASPDLLSEGRQWWSHVRFLADDSLQGRNTGSPGYRKAAEYLAQEFERVGLKPAGTSGPFQTVRFDSRVVDEPQSSLALIHDGKAERLAIGDDAVIGLREKAPAGNLEAPLYFVGYGLTVPEHHYDDLAGVDLKGKIIVSINGGPKEIPAALLSHYRTARERAPFLTKAGVIGTIGVPNPKDMDVPWERSKLARVMPSMVLADPAMQDRANLQITLQMNPASLDKLLAGSGHTAGELFALANERKPLPRFPLKVALRSRVVLKTTTAESPNVIAVLPGSDPVRKKEYVVMSAHLDHVGTGAPINGDAIYNGAMDNASGVATLIETARRMKGSKLARSVLFVAVCGEEKGLLGSRYFAGNPTVNDGPMVADINLDMFLPLFPLERLFAYGLEESTLGKQMQEVARDFHVTLQPDPEPNRNIFIRSDQYSFIREGVPSLLFGFGYAPGSPEEKTVKEWLHTRYHGPADDVNQPVDLQAAAKFNRMMAELLQKVANAPERPRWNDNSFFRRFADGRARQSKN